MPLKVALRPRERLVVNGATLGAGDKPAEIFLFSEAVFLRGREMLSEFDVDGPERALYLALQESYLRPGGNTTAQLAAAMQDFSAVHPDRAAMIAGLIAEGRHYQAMRACSLAFPRGR